MYYYRNKVQSLEISLNGLFSQDKEFRAIIVVSEAQIRQAPARKAPPLFLQEESILK